MATCKECLHYEMCVVPNEQGSYYLKADRDCRYFKDKTKYVEQKHGWWKKANKRPKSYIYRCSACGKEAYFCGVGCGYKYCPNCGAEMESDDNV